VLFLEIPVAVAELRVRDRLDISRLPQAHIQAHIRPVKVVVHDMLKRARRFKTTNHIPLRSHALEGPEQARHILTSSTPLAASTLVVALVLLSSLVRTCSGGYEEGVL